MLKNNKWKIIISSLLILLPIAVGLILWNNLPQTLPIHWNAQGSPDGWSSRIFAVCGLPLILLAVHWLAVFITFRDPKNKNQHPKVSGLIFWLLPAISLFTASTTYSVAMGTESNPMLTLILLMGFLFVVVGNYMPKCKQNSTIGIKIKWTLENEENWNATHRFTGKVWVICGLLLIACAFLPETLSMWIMVAALLPLAALPIAYSWRYHRKQLQAGTAVITPFVRTKAERIILTVALSIVAAVLVLCTLLMFTGDISLDYQETAFTIQADAWFDLTVAYDSIDAIEYRDADVVGNRTNGLGSARLLAGSFFNKEFGAYTRYSYTGCEACVVLRVNGQTLVLNGPDAESTKAIYDSLSSRLP